MGVRILGIFTVVVVLAWAGASRADPQDSAAARELFEEARRLMAGGDYEAASRKLASALALSNGRGIKFQLAVCEEKLGRVASAWTLYVEVADASRDAHETDRERVARAHAAEILPRVPHVRLTVADASAVVRRDDVVLAAGAWDTPLAVDPGKHVIRAERPGHRAWESAVDVAEGATVDVRVPELDPIALALAPPLVVIKREERAQPFAPPPPRRPWRAIAWTTTVTGALGLATGGAFAIASAARYGSTASMCDALDHCSPEGSAIRSEALGYGDVATGLFIGGAVALAAGLVMFLVSGHR